MLTLADDACEAIRALVAFRPGARVLRYRPGGTYRDWTLHDYAAGTEPLVATAAGGTQTGRWPMYLLQPDPDLRRNHADLHSCVV